MMPLRHATGDTSVLTIRTGTTGTYVIGASLRPRELTLVTLNQDSAEPLRFDR